FARAFDVRLVEQTTASWEFWFGLLEKFVEHHGHARVPHSEIMEDYPLGAWVNTQRNSYAKGSIQAHRLRRLENLPGWTWDTRADQWEEGFGRLLNYVKQHDHARVPQSYTDGDGYRLGSW